MLSLLLDTSLSFHLQLVAAILCAWYGGLGPGVSATLILTLLSGTVFRNSDFPVFSSENMLTSTIFFTEGIFLSIMSEARLQANAKKDEFIGFASHELKNPITAIKAYTEILKRKLLQEKKHNYVTYVSRIGSQADKTVMLINELLDVTKIEAGKLSLYYEAFKLNDLVKEIVTDQKAITNTHKIVISGKSKKQIYADKHRMSEVFINLLTNAVKYSPNAKKVDVFIKDKKRSVQVSVKDYGLGIDNSSAQLIFERFFRSRTTETDKIQGLGLGLYISSQIVKQHKGKIWVESKKGKGSTFHVLLPAGA